MKIRNLLCVLLVLILISSTACTAQNEAVDLNTLDLGMPLSKVQDWANDAGFGLEFKSEANAENLYEVYVLHLQSAQWNGYQVDDSPAQQMILKFTPGFADGETQVESLLAGMEFTVSQDDSEAFSRWIQHRLQDMPQIPERESGIDGEMYDARYFSELTAKEYTRTAQLARSSRAQFGSKEAPLSDAMAVLDEQFADHLTTVRNGRNVPMCRIILQQNAQGEAVLSVEGYGEALYRYEQSVL